MSNTQYRCPNGCGVVIEPFWKYCPQCAKSVPIDVYEKLLRPGKPTRADARHKKRIEKGGGA